MRAGPRARVLRVLAVARRLADPTDPIGREARARLPAVSGLSPEGVELALATALEREATSDDLDRLVAAAGAAPRCWVVASANVCTAPVRSIALAVAASGEVHVRPSRRDPIVAELVVRVLGDDPAFAAAGGRVALASDLAPRPGDHVHAYGSDATMRAIAASLPGGVTLRGHGTGIGLALVGAGDDARGAAEAIARDVAIFDQRGCLSPRVVVVDGAGPAATRVVAALDQALGRWQRLVPRGPLDEATAGELARWARTVEAVGDLAQGPGHAIAALDPGLDPGRGLPLGPAARAVVVLSGEAAAPALAAVARHVAAVGRDAPASPLARAIEALAPGARTSPLGRMQRPRLDGPVDRRDTEFHAPSPVD